MPTVTAVGPERRGRVAVALDGSPWRELPVEVVARTLLRVGVELDRGRLRELRRELRRSEALATAARALRHRDHSARGLSVRLEAAGVTEAERREVVETLERIGYVDDERLACRRAAVLAERGWGDAAIAADLEQKGIDGELAAAAISTLESERERAAREVARRGPGRRTAAHLARRGFGEDVLELALDPPIAEDG